MELVEVCVSWSEHPRYQKKKKKITLGIRVLLAAKVEGSKRFFV